MLGRYIRPMNRNIAWIMNSILEKELGRYIRLMNRNSSPVPVYTRARIGTLYTSHESKFDDVTKELADLCCDVIYVTCIMNKQKNYNIHKVSTYNQDDRNIIGHN